MVYIKRAYEPPKEQDGFRVLIDRLWPRGIKKENLEFDEWIKELAPSPALRKRFGHNPDHWNDFQKKYRQELSSPEAKKQIDRLARIAKRGRLTLLYSAHDEKHNNAVVLQRIINRKTKAA